MYNADLLQERLSTRRRNHISGGHPEWALRIFARRNAKIGKRALRSTANCTGNEFPGGVSEDRSETKRRKWTLVARVVSCNDDLKGDLYSVLKRR